jgi:hypothetical protein
LDGVAVSVAEPPEFIDVGLAAKEMDSGVGDDEDEVATHCPFESVYPALQVNPTVFV